MPLDESNHVMQQGAIHKPWYRRALPLFFVVLAALLLLPSASIYYRYSGGRSCGGCHEIWQPYTDWHTSTHRNVACAECHGDVLTLDAGFHLKNMSQLLTHVRGNVPDKVRLKPDDIRKMETRCAKCHEQEYADWKASSHAATYKEIFLDEKHNHQEHLMDDCLRCHAMHFDGGIRDLVTPINTKGPWQLRDASLEKEPVIPCITCHQMHRQGNPQQRPATKPVNPGESQEIARSSLAFYDRRGEDYVALARLSLPSMRDRDRPVKISPDIRQALCYQCHAPLANREVASGDDRTAVGVHEGLSCLACHEGHGQKTRASCSECHPKLSNCGIDVQKMDTTYKSTKSAHNIHFVKCLDCHPKGVPPKKEQAAVGTDMVHAVFPR